MVHLSKFVDGSEALRKAVDGIDKSNNLGPLKQTRIGSRTDAKEMVSLTGIKKPAYLHEYKTLL